MSIKDKFSRERIAKFFDREGFYIVLFLCVCVVAITAVWVSRTGKKEQAPNGADENQITVQTPEDEIPAKDTTSKPGLPASSDGKVSTGEKTDTTSSSKNNTATTPVSTAAPAKTGTVSKTIKLDNPLKDPLTKDSFIRPHSDPELVWYESFGEYRTHQGVDIKSYEWTEVLAASDGKVVDVRDDNDNPSGLGWTVVVDHGNGYMTVYANLDEDIAVKKNDTIKKGQQIGVVGSSSIYEMSPAKDEDVESHLHFEVIKKGKTNESNESLDPMNFLTVEK
jgi:murein DD-endopeptidase MepM/ murein hydrolase activator NlpD